MTETDHDEFRGQLGAYAIGALGPAERATLEQHLAGCPSCRKEVATHQETLNALAPSTTVPDRVWERIEATIRSDQGEDEPEHEAASDTTVTPLGHARGRSWLVGAAGAVAAMAAAVALTLVATNDGDLGTPAVRAQIVATSAEAAVSGGVRLFEPRTPEGRIVLDLAAIPPSPAGHHYQVWVLRAESGGAMEAIGAFSPDSGATQIELPLPGPGNYAAVDISVQEDGGPPEHSGVSIAGAMFS